MINIYFMYYPIQVSQYYSAEFFKIYYKIQASNVSKVYYLNNKIKNST